eukprot:CAMPEP_0177789804 /NCGR_PEP_ID=MMETSP0491_2-20121128/22971_1 /TAXON_ID=63592 /ORGANISM="Tetraselmis chuii, Strain PLY429" /LENGTH=57 /DNA_ID=CAMNT_0019311745 /DNA_START=599 /DNA_END=768 /DNA_ORIENTATION=+
MSSRSAESSRLHDRRLRLLSCVNGASDASGLVTRARQPLRFRHVSVEDNGASAAMPA